MNNPYENYYNKKPNPDRQTTQAPINPPVPPAPSVQPQQFDRRPDAVMAQQPAEAPVPQSAPYGAEFTQPEPAAQPAVQSAPQPAPQPEPQPAAEPAQPAPEYPVDEYYRENVQNSENYVDSYAYDNYNSHQPAASSYAQPYDGYTSSYGTEAQPSYSDSQFDSAYPSYTSPYVERERKNDSKPKEKKDAKYVTRTALVVILIISILSSAALGIGGGWLAANYLNTNGQNSGGVTINKSDSDSPSYASSTATLSTTQIVEKAADSVVEITTESVVTGSFSQQYIQSGAGSGVIIDKNGYIITNYHVIEGASHITVTLRNKDEYTDVEVVGTYSAGDLALLKIEPKNTLTAATLGDSSKISVGDYSVVIGNPLGQLGGSVTDGIISALDREITIDDETMNLLQTNAEISPGNSGGGLFNGNGELIGIVNAKSISSNAEGIGFAIPINDVQDVLPDLKQYGYVKGQVDLGMSLAEVNSTAQLWMYGVKQQGVYVAGVDKGSNAESAGFRYGDIITAVDGTNVTSKAELNAIIKKHSVGDKVTFTVYRQGQSGQLTMKLAEYTKDSATESKSQSEDIDGDSIWDMFDLD